MDLTAYFDYLKSFAVNHNSIGHTDDNKHYFRVDINELENAKRSVANYPAVAAMNPIYSVSGAISSNMRKQYQGNLIILDKITDKGDAIERTDKESALMEIAEDFISKFINDRKSFDEGEQGFALPGLDFNGFTTELIPESYTSLCGVLIGFRFNEPLKRFDASRWDNETLYTP